MYVFLSRHTLKVITWSSIFIGVFFSYFHTKVPGLLTSIFQTWPMGGKNHAYQIEFGSLVFESFEGAN